MKKKIKVLVVSDRGGKRVYEIGGELKGIEKPVDNIEECST